MSRSSKEDSIADANASYHILIADDEQSIRELLSFKLGKEYDIATVSSGDACLEYVFSTDTPMPALITLDLMMPGINGHQVLKELKQDDQSKDIPIIMVTAVDQEQDAVKALDLGADDFVRKPVALNELSARIRNILE